LLNPQYIAEIWGTKTWISSTKNSPGSTTLYHHKKQKEQKKNKLEENHLAIQPGLAHTVKNENYQTHAQIRNSNAVPAVVQPCIARGHVNVRTGRGDINGRAVWALS
jgi:hypothetical protein